jgi:signal transduction histidine kinase/ActR/RegA family two-component response regulator
MGAAITDSSRQRELFWGALPPAARIYVTTVIVAGAVLAATFVPLGVDRPFLVIVLFAAAFITSIWKVNLPLGLNNGSTLSVSYAADLMSLLLLGPRLAMVVAMAGAWAQCAFGVRKPYPIYRTVFSIAVVAITMRAVAAAYYSTGGIPAPTSFADLTKPLVAMIATYFLVNTGLVAGAIALAARQSVWQVWHDNFLWSGPSFIVAGGAGALAAVVIARGEYWLAPFMVAPIYLTYRTYKIFLGRIEDEQRHLAETRQLHREALDALSQARDAEAALAAEQAKASKLDSLGLLAGGIAHDFNNILAASLANVSIARQPETTRANVEATLEDAKKACVRARQLTQQLLTFAKGGAPIKKMVRMARLVRESAGLALSGSDVGWYADIDPDLWSVNADEGQLVQVLHNVIINAQQASSKGGHIMLRAVNVSEPEDRWEYGLKVPAGPYVRVSVSDEGVGIPEGDLGRIFEPYFSTKPTGSGLGLATSYSIIKNHGGYIGVESTVGRGTTVHIGLPALLSSEMERPVAPLPTVDGSGRVLVLDDEEPIRKATIMLLHSLGYQAESVNTGAAAVELYKRALQQGSPFDMVLLDLTIPGGMGGREVIRLLRDLDPDVKAIVCSGYAQDAVMGTFRDFGFKAVITKPFTLQELGSTLREVATAPV